jgi:signal transduction histidine kinase
LYRSVQAVVDRLMYGHRGHPDRVLRNLASRLGGALAPDEVPQRVVATVTSALHLQWAALDERHDGGYERLAEHGTPHGLVESVPVLYRTEELGRLLVCPRRGEARLSRRDMRVLRQLATPTGVAMNAGRLTDELTRSRERLVLGREEERQRLRRDLHDNLSPALSGIALAAAAARGCIRGDPAGAEQLLGRIEREASASAGSVGRLLAGLRPPDLDELGLARALRERLRADDGLGDTAIVVDIDDPLPAMSPAVELAAYRVVVEALANVFRHAHATTCTVRVAGADSHLAVEVTDDGRGVSDVHLDGVGLTSARERARDVGGSITVQARPGGGTTLRTELPLRGTG